jgi:chemotaxis signal transduction protein
MNQPAAPTEATRWDEALQELRAAFDASFAVAGALAPLEQEDMLAIVAGDVDLALPLAGVTRLEPRRRLVTLNGGAPGLLGLCGMRGQLVPVFCLARLMGARSIAVHDPWVVLVGAPAPIGLAFERFEGFLRVDKQALTELEASERTRFTRRAFPCRGAHRRVVDIEGVLEVISAATTEPLLSSEE